MTKQEIFNTIVTHCLKQNAKATRSERVEVTNNNCAYFAKDGKKCAIGCLIRPDEYFPWMEGASLLEIFSNKNCPQSLYNRLNEHLYLLETCQEVHDNEVVSNWQYNFAKIAEDYCLEMPS